MAKDYRKAGEFDSVISNKPVKKKVTAEQTSDYILMAKILMVEKERKGYFTEARLKHK